MAACLRGRDVRLVVLVSVIGVSEIVSWLVDVRWRFEGRVVSSVEVVVGMFNGSVVGVLVVDGLEIATGLLEAIDLLSIEFVVGVGIVRVARPVAVE